MMDTVRDDNRIILKESELDRNWNISHYHCGLHLTIHYTMVSKKSNGERLNETSLSNELYQTFYVTLMLPCLR